ncbi:MAG: LamG domain-containing protein [Alphaproteobacteria bacterium]
MAGFFTSGAVHADCAAPVGIAGEMGFDLTGGGEMEYCDDTNWVSMNNSVASADSADLVGHWKLDETSGSSIADSSGNGNTGTWSDGADDDVSGETVSSQIGTGLNFDGSNDIINAGSDASIDDIFAGGGTIAAWIYPVGWGENSFGRIVHKASASNGNNGYIFYVDDNAGTTQDETLGFDHGFASGEEGWSGPSNTITLNQWNHVAVTYDNSSDSNSPSLYVNGEAITPLTVNNSGTGVADSDAAQNLFIGNIGGQTRTFDGIMDDVRFYDGELTAAEVAALVVCTKPGEVGYDFTTHVLLWCDANLDAYNAGVAGAGGGGCAAGGALAAGVEGTVQYDTGNDKLVFCDGASWVNIPN